MDKTDHKWCVDVVFREDLNRTRKDNSAEIFHAFAVKLKCGMLTFLYKYAIMKIANHHISPNLYSNIATKEMNSGI